MPLVGQINGEKMISFQFSSFLILLGFGYSVITIITLSELYYAVICGWAFFYLFIGFQSQLPWYTCADNATWHTPDCYTIDLGADCSNKMGGIYWNLTCVENNTYCLHHGYNHYEPTNETCVNSTSELKLKSVLADHSVSPAEDYFNGYIVGFTKDDNSGERYSW